MVSMDGKKRRECFLILNRDGTIVVYSPDHLIEYGTLSVATKFSAILPT
jgi:hypothetical protein